jgi:hypothetical protein
MDSENTCQQNSVSAGFTVVSEVGRRACDLGSRFAD